MSGIQYTSESRKLHADMMFRVAEKVILAIATGLLGVPFMLAFSKETTTTMQLYLLFLTVVCVFPFCLIRAALSHYKKLHRTQVANKPQSSTIKVEKGRVSISIEEATQISISVNKKQGEEND